MTTKVKHTVSQKTSQGEVIVAKGKLMLLEYLDRPLQIGSLCNHGNNGYTIIKDEKHLKAANELGYIKALPIIISETEDITPGDNYITIRPERNKFLPKYIGDIQKCVKVENGDVISLMADNNPNHTIGTEKQFAFKILALPNNFSSKHLKVIIDSDSTLKNGADVYVECNPEEIWGNNGSVFPISYKVKINYENFITLHKIELDVFADMRALGLTSDQCSDVCDYIEKHFTKK